MKEVICKIAQGVIPLTGSLRTNVSMAGGVGEWGRVCTAEAQRGACWVLGLFKMQVLVVAVGTFTCVNIFILHCHAQDSCP